MAEPYPKRLKTLSTLDCRTLNVDDFASINLFDIEKAQWDGVSPGVTFKDRTHFYYLDDKPRSVCQQYLDWLYKAGGVGKSLDLIDLQVVQTAAGPQLLMFRAPPHQKLPPDLWHKISQFNPREGPDAFGVMTMQRAGDATNPLRMKEVALGVLDYAPIDDVCETVTMNMSFIGPPIDRRMEGLTRECELFKKVVLVGAQIEINVTWIQVTSLHPRVTSRFLRKVRRLVVESRDFYRLDPWLANMWMLVLANHPNLTLEFNRAITDDTFLYAVNPYRDRVHIRVLKLTCPTIDNFSAHIESVVE